MKIKQKFTEKIIGCNFDYWKKNVLANHLEENYEIIDKPDLVDVMEIDTSNGNKNVVDTIDRKTAISRYLQKSDRFTIRDTQVKYDESYRRIPQLLNTETLPTQNNIQQSTKRNILDSFIITRISWYGNLVQPDFLSRLYNLDLLPSSDLRYTTASEDIHKHTVLNNDWPDEWFFSDRRFNLLYSDDHKFIEFLNLTIHPLVRDNEDEITTLIEIYKNNLERDGYTIDKIGAIANKDIFGAVQLISVVGNTKTFTVKPPIRHSVKKAIVIGCSSYSHTSQLINPINDANSMEKMLQSLNFDVTKLLDPTQKSMKESIDDFGEKMKGSDVCLFYFAGHGVQVKGLNYLIPVDAKLSSEKLVEYDCVEAGRILAHMEDARASINLILLDACRNNPFERSWGRGLHQRGLATMNSPKGSLIAYSTSPGQTASDGLGLNGLYTEALLNHISAKSVPINTMFQRVRLEVMEKSKEEQVPWESTSLTEDFFFNH